MLFICSVNGQSPNAIEWAPDGNSYFKSEAGDIAQYLLPANQRSVLISKNQLIPVGQNRPLAIASFKLSADLSQALIFTNTRKVWRYNTKGDYWVYNLKTQKLIQLGKTLPTATLMFAKLSPNGKLAAYVSQQNLYLENLETGTIQPLTTEGSRRNIFGTFDWVYEEEFGVRDGFRWSPDGTKIALWHVDASKVRDIPLINNTDSIAPFVIPIEYPLVGEAPSPVRIGVIDIVSRAIQWMNVPGDPRQNYIPLMEWAANSNELVLQQFNRKQNQSKIYLCDARTGNATVIYDEKDEAFIECRGQFPGGPVVGWDWINGGKEFIWASEKDGWMHLYKITRDGKKETLLTPGNYDVAKIDFVDEANNMIYFTASLENTLQRYLYKTKMDGKGKLIRVTPADQPGTHSYIISPNARYARHSFQNHFTAPLGELINLATHTPVDGVQTIPAKIKASESNKGTEFFKVTTSEGVILDGWMVKPRNFDPTKKYPVVFFVYGEPGSTTVKDIYGVSYNFLYQGDMAEDGYFYIGLDNRGTPSLKGRAWRKSIHRSIGNVNIRDQAQGVREVLKWPFIDANRTAIWGWSGGANTTLHLLGQYPDLFKAGIAVASVASQLTYDNIYTERYMGLPQENMDDYIKGSPITYAKNIKAKLLYIHGTGDDNVHYQNAELLLNEFIKHNIQIQFMAYPNRTHSISEGEGTQEHLSTLFTSFLKQYCPPGGR